MKPKANKDTVKSDSIIAGDIKKESNSISPSRNKQTTIAILIVILIILSIAGVGVYFYKQNSNNNANDVTLTENEQYSKYLSEAADKNKPTNSSDLGQQTTYYVLKVDELSFANKNQELTNLYLTEISKSDVKLPLDQAEATVRAMQASAKTKEAAPLIEHIITLLSSSTATNDSSRLLVQQRLNYYIALKESI